MKPALIGGIIFVMVILIIAVISFRSEDDAQPVVQEEAAAEEEPVTQEEQAKAMTEPTSPVEEGAEEEKKEEEAAPPPAVEEVAADEPDTDPTKVKGLVGHYTADSFDERANVWKDKSGNGNDADEVKGEPEVVEENGVKFLLGGSTSGVRFPSAVLTNGRKYTMIAVTKINSTSGGGGRLFDGYGNRLSLEMAVVRETAWQQRWIGWCAQKWHGVDSTQ
jgi:type IV secretory pathway VirB10-like protein